MIEIKITIDTALDLLLNRMKVELKFRQNSGRILKSKRLEDLTYKELFPIVEAAIADTMFMLPVELLTQETNLNYIITATVKSLSRIFHYTGFADFSSRQTQKLLDPIYRYVKNQINSKDFQNN